MATTRPGNKSIKLSDVSLWAADAGSIHITSDDPAARGTCTPTSTTRTRSATARRCTRSSPASSPRWARQSPDGGTTARRSSPPTESALQP